MINSLPRKTFYILMVVLLTVLVGLVSFIYTVSVIGKPHYKTLNVEIQPRDIKLVFGEYQLFQARMRILSGLVKDSVGRTGTDSVFVYDTLSFSTNIEAGSRVTEASYIIFVDGSTYYVRNGTTGAIDHSGTNATDLFQTAINNLDSIGGGSILVKAGTYELTGLGSAGSGGNRHGFELEDNIAIFGEGAGITIFRQAEYATINRIITTKDKDAKENITLAYFTIDGNYLGQDYSGIDDDYYLGCGIAHYGNYWNIHHVEIRDVGQYGGLVVHGYYNQFSDIVVDTTHFQPGAAETQRQWTTGVMVTYQTSYHNTLNNIIIKDTAGDGFQFEDNAHSNVLSNLVVINATMTGLHYMVTTNNTASNIVIYSSNQYGVSFGSTSPYNTITNVDVRDCVKTGIYVLSEGITISNGFVRDNTAAGVEIYHGNFSSIANLKINNNGDRGIWIRNNSFNNTIVANYIWENGNYGIDEDSPADFNIILANIVHDNANGQIVTVGGSTIKQYNQERSLWNVKKSLTRFFLHDYSMLMPIFLLFFLSHNQFFRRKASLL